MPREETQEAAKLLFINAGESKEQVVEDYQVRTLCWLQMQPESKPPTEAQYVASEVDEL